MVHGLSPGDTVPYWNTPEVWEKAGSMSTNCFYSVRKTGDIEYITGKDGKIENAYTYDAFGNITNSTELVKNRYTYMGSSMTKLHSNTT